MTKGPVSSVIGWDSNKRDFSVDQKRPIHLRFGPDLPCASSDLQQHAPHRSGWNEKQSESKQNGTDVTALKLLVHMVFCHAPSRLLFNLHRPTVVFFGDAFSLTRSITEETRKRIDLVALLRQFFRATVNNLWLFGLNSRYSACSLAFYDWNREDIIGDCAIYSETTVRFVSLWFE